MFSLRFDMRTAEDGPPPTDLYQAAMDMAEWGDRNGCIGIAVSEHHASPDGYLPAPMIMAAALAARTQRVPIQICALLTPLYQPVQLAEHMAVLDLISRGRVSYVLGLGYRDEEFDLYGVPRSERGPRLEDTLRLLRKAWAGEEFDTSRGPVRVTPAPLSPNGPFLLLGGGTPAAARRAARLGLGMMTERLDGLEDAYRRACGELGVQPGIFIGSGDDAVTAAFVSEDPDRTWGALAPFLLSDASLYAEWNATAGKAPPTSVSHAESLEQLRQSEHPYRVFTPDEAADWIRRRGPLTVHPLCGGAPPEHGWETLRLLDQKVRPLLGSD